MGDVIIDGVDLDGLNYTVKVPFNGTFPDGGDPLVENLNIWYEVGLESRHPPPITSGTPAEHDPAEWRHRLDDHGHRARVAHDSRSRVSAGAACCRPERREAYAKSVQLLLLRAGAEKVGPLSHLAVGHGDGRHHVPMVLLGVLADLLPHGQLLHWRP